MGSAGLLDGGARPRGGRRPSTSDTRRRARRRRRHLDCRKRCARRTARPSPPCWRASTTKKTTWEEADWCSDFGLAARGRPLKSSGGRRGGPPRSSRRRSTALGAVDTHCHAQFAPEPPTSAAELVVCSTGPGDWDAVTALAPTAKAVAYGVHPWWACDASEGWLDALERRLVESPTALVGECGLDKYAGGRSPPGSGNRRPGAPGLDIPSAARVARELDERHGALRRRAAPSPRRASRAAAAGRVPRRNGSPSRRRIRAVGRAAARRSLGSTLRTRPKTPRPSPPAQESLLAESDASGEFEARVADATVSPDVRGWSLDVAEVRLAGNARAPTRVRQ